MPQITHTDEQLAILSAIGDTSSNLIIEARAGSGKTSILLDGLERLKGDTLFMAYNRAIADELKRKAGSRFGIEVMSRTAISTVHSHGLRAFTTSGLRAKTLSGKLNFMLGDMVEHRVASDDDLHRNLGKITKLAGMAKAFGFGLQSSAENFPALDDKNQWLQMADHFDLESDLVGDTSIEEIVEWAIKLLKASNARTNSIDFDDMIYLPLLLNLKIPLYDNVLLDEAQDINATRRELAFRSMKPSGRIIAVGDPFQAIYGFTGADVASLSRIGQRAKCEALPLTICWRCDEAIIASAQKQVPDIKARPNAREGQVLTIDFEKDRFLDLPAPGDAILCRLNKPNVAVCLGLLRRGKRAKIEGRDIGARLEEHAKKAEPLYAHRPLDELLLALDDYQQREIGKLVARNKSESVIASLEDEIEATKLIAERAIEDAIAAGHDPTWPDFQRLIFDLFGDQISTGFITLSSVHKSKGREWLRVFILGSNDWMPFFAAKQPWELEQEQNLIYVAKTRAERTLVLVENAQSAIDRGLHRKLASDAAEQPVPDGAKISLPPTVA